MISTLTVKEDSDEFKLLFITSPVPMMIYGIKDRKILAINKEAEKLYGYSKNEFLKLDLYHIDSGHDNEQNAGNGNTIHVQQNGNKIAVKLNEQPVRYKFQNAVLVTIVHSWREELKDKTSENNTKLVKSFKKLHQKVPSRENFRSKELEQKGTELIAVINKKGKYKYVDTTTASRLDVEIANTIGKSALDFIHPKDVSNVKKKLKLTLEQEHVFVPPYRYRAKNKKWRWLETQFINQTFNPKIKGIIAKSQDVTYQMEEKMNSDFIQSLAKTASRTESLSESLNEVLSNILLFSTINIAEIWLVSEDRESIDLFSSLSNPEELSASFYQFKPKNHFKFREGLPGHVWAEQDVIIWENIHKNQKFLRKKNALNSSMKSGIGIPLMNNGDFLGTLICLSQYKVDEIKAQTKFLASIGKAVAPVLRQKITEESYKNLFSLSPYPHCMLDYNGIVRRTNKLFAELLKYEPKNILGKEILNHIHPDEKSDLKDRIRLSIKNNVFNSIPIKFTTSQNEMIWLEWNGKIIPESKKIILVAKDITDQVTSKEKLKAAYKKLKAAQKIAKIGYWSRDLDKEITEWSEETYRIFGYSKKNFKPTQENLIKTFHPSDRHYLENPVENYLIPGKVSYFEHRIITGANEIRWVRQEIKLITDSNKNPKRIEGVIQDITDKKNQEIQLKLSNERFILAQKASNELIWVMDFESKIISRGEGYLRQFKYKPKENLAENNSWMQKIYSEDVEHIRTSFYNTLKDKTKNFWRGEYRMVNRSNSISYLVDRCYILRDENKKVIKVVGSVLDISRSLKQINSIKKQNEQLREIAWMQSHTIRTPLSRILGLIYLYKEAGGGGKTLEEILDHITESAEELDNVVKKIVETSNKFKHEADLID